MASPALWVPSKQHHAHSSSTESWRGQATSMHPEDSIMPRSPTEQSQGRVDWNRLRGNLVAPAFFSEEK